MRVVKVNPGLSFGRALKQEEIKEYTETLNEGKKLAGQTGHSVFIMPSTSLPQPPNLNTGTGYLASKEAGEYFDYMKTYLGFNVVEDLPAGEFTTLHYDGSALALGSHNINPQLLTTEKYEKLLTQEEFDEIVKSNTKENKDTIANFENVMGKDGAQNNALKKAHERFKSLEDNSELKQKYNTFVKENESWLNFARKNDPDQDFFKFKQFLAAEHLKDARTKLNEKGLKLCGDVLLNFSDDEVKAFPNAFKKDYYIGVPDWGATSLNYDTILDETSDANKLLKQKVQLAAKRYDMLRMDAAWTYVTPLITPKNETAIDNKNKKKMGENVLNLIEKWIKEVKGEDFDLKNILYEFDASAEEFTIYENGELIQPIRNRIKVYNNTYMSDEWGSNKAFLNRGWPADTFSIGVGNHDPQSLRQLANEIPNENGCCPKQNSLKALAEILKLDMEKLKNPIEFAKAKFAEPMTAKNNHFFFMDVFGREENFNEHGPQYETNFRRRVPADYKQAFHKALQEGYGFNIMDSLEKVFKAKDLDKSHPQLYAKIVKFRDILTQKEETVKKPQEQKPIEVIQKTSDDDVIKITSKGAKKSNKFLWFAAAAAAVAAGGFAIYKSQPQKNKG